MDEPTRLHSCVRDSEGDLWIRGTKWWYNQRGQGKLMWDALVAQYGPVGVDAATELATQRADRLGMAR